jgi:hypothetical protein
MKAYIFIAALCLIAALLVWLEWPNHANIYGALTSLGTLSAVCISLWLVLGKKKRFSIKDVRMLLSRTQKEGSSELIDIGNFLYVRLENHLEFDMQVFEVAISYESKNKTGLRGSGVHLPCEGGRIPPHSQYDIKVQIPRDAEPNSYKDAKRITLTVATSFGDKTIPFPPKWLPQLIDSIEKKDDAPSATDDKSNHREAV